MKKAIDRNPNMVHLVDENGETLRTFCSKYAVAKWLIRSGYCNMPDNTKSYVQLAGGLKAGFNRKQGDIITSHGFRFKHGEKIVPGSLYNERIPTKQCPPVIALYKNGYVKEYETLAKLKDDFSEHIIFGNSIDSGKFIDGADIAVYWKDGKLTKFPTLKNAAEVLHTNETRLRNMIRNKQHVRGKFVVISKK